MKTHKNIQVQNRFASKFSKLITILGMVLFSNFTYSQAPDCNYQLQHSIDNCTIDVTVEFYDSNGLCNSISYPSLAGSTPVFPTCNCGGAVTNIVVTLNNVGGFGITGGTGFVDVNSTNDSGNTSIFAPCNSSGNYILQWNYNSTNITN